MPLLSTFKTQLLLSAPIKFLFRQTWSLLGGVDFYGVGVSLLLFSLVAISRRVMPLLFYSPFIKTIIDAYSASYHSLQRGRSSVYMRHVVLYVIFQSLIELGR
jgi:hypothetical protein